MVGNAPDFRSNVNKVLYLQKKKKAFSGKTKKKKENKNRGKENSLFVFSMAVGWDVCVIACCCQRKRREHGTQRSMNSESTPIGCPPSPHISPESFF